MVEVDYLDGRRRDVCRMSSSARSWNLKLGILLTALVLSILLFGRNLFHLNASNVKSRATKTTGKNEWQRDSEYHQTFIYFKLPLPGQPFPASAPRAMH